MPESLQRHTNLNDCSSARHNDETRRKDASFRRKRPAGPLRASPPNNSITPPTLEEPGSRKAEAAGAEEWGLPSSEAEGAGVAFKNIPRGVQHARDEPAGTAVSPGSGDKPLRARAHNHTRAWFSASVASIRRKASNAGARGGSRRRRFRRLVGKLQRRGRAHRVCVCVTAR